MGKIKSKLIKRSAKTLLEKDIGFSEDFKENKVILGNTMPSKKIRNQMSGYLTKLAKQKRQKQEMMLKAK